MASFEVKNFLIVNWGSSVKGDRQREALNTRRTSSLLLGAINLFLKIECNFKMLEYCRLYHIPRLLDNELYPKHCSEILEKRLDKISCSE